jgi:tetratricopeptide (TPR) repeat protein
MGNIHRLLMLCAFATTLTLSLRGALADDWSVCMTAASPAAASARACSEALRRKDLSPFHRSLLLAARGDDYMHLHRYAAARQDYTGSIDLDPVEDSAYALRAAAESKLHALIVAERDASAAISRHLARPSNANNGSSDVLASEYTQRGQIRLVKLNPSGALADFQAAMKADPAGITQKLRSLSQEAVRSAVGGTSHAPHSRQFNTLRVPHLDR